MRGAVIIRAAVTLVLKGGDFGEYIALWAYVLASVWAYKKSMAILIDINF